MPESYDALLVVAFGGPEQREDVLPFLENVLRGRRVPRERMLEVAEHYYHFDGVSPINAQVREFIAELKPDLVEMGIDLPVYWGNRNWHPLLPDTLRQMETDGIKRALALVLSGYSSYSSCRQYRENIMAAQEICGSPPVIDKVRVFYNHPRFVAANAEHLRTEWERIPEAKRAAARVAFTAHSIPMSMANSCNYAEQLTEACRLVADEVGVPAERWRLVYQSRSGRPQDPWLEPDICDHLKSLREDGVEDVVVLPIGFLSDHMEVLFDLDHEAQDVAGEVGLAMRRAKTVGTHPEFIRMWTELVLERMDDSRPKLAIGEYGPNHDVCPIDCCPAPRR